MTLELTEDLLHSINKIVRNTEKLEPFLTWAESETYGGELTTMSEEAQTLMVDFLSLVQQAEIDYLMRCNKNEKK